MESWVPATKAQYEGAIKRWFADFNQYDIQHFEATVKQGAEFLAHLFVTTDLKYSAINTTHSALSALLKPTNGVSFGSHPLVTRMLPCF